MWIINVKIPSAPSALSSAGTIKANWSGDSYLTRFDLQALAIGAIYSITSLTNLSQSDVHWLAGSLCLFSFSLHITFSWNGELLLRHCCFQSVLWPLLHLYPNDIRVASPTLTLCCKAKVSSKNLWKLLSIFPPPLFVCLHTWVRSTAETLSDFPIWTSNVPKRKVPIT